MNDELKKFIKHLSLRDKKTLTQKALKLSEECGELAKAVLPYENAYATTHRFIKKEKILEEAIDSMLVAQSIAYSLDYSDDEIEEMFKRKALKWSNLQACEDNVKYPLPYEIHITIDYCRVLDQFKEDCKKIGVKPILLDLHSNKGKDVVKDLMTSSIFHGDNAGAYNEMKRISRELSYLSYNVLREKIETVPWHPAAPCQKYDRLKMPKNCYFESHLGILVNNSETTLKLLREICVDLGVYLSKNVFKRVDEENYIIMGTLRSYDDVLEVFQEQVSNTVRKLKDYFIIEKEIIEFSVFDSKIDHDSGWFVNT